METKEIRIQVPEGYEIDRENSSYERIVFKKKEATIYSWEDLKKIEGYYINTNSNIAYSGGLLGPFKEHKNVFLDRKHVKSALALAQISQLLPYYDSNVNWDRSTIKHCIVRMGNKIYIDTWQSLYSPLAFNSREEAKRFLKYNEQLVKDYFML